MMKPLLVLFLISSLVRLTIGTCLEIIESGVTPDDEKTITDVHNQCRQSIANGTAACAQPKACHMPDLHYDQKLGESAQDVANKCEARHSICTDERFWWVGQNIYYEYSSSLSKGANWKSAINGWFNECHRYTYCQSPDGSTGHYTQVVWSETLCVGCGYVFCRSDNPKFPYQKFYFCNYGPGGNIVNECIYQTEPCS